MNLQVPNEQFLMLEETVRDLREELETTKTDFALEQQSQIDEVNSLKEQIKLLMMRNEKLGEEKEEVSRNYEQLREGYDQVLQQFEQASSDLQESEKKNSSLSRRNREFQKECVKLFIKQKYKKSLPMIFKVRPNIFDCHSNVCFLVDVY